MPTPPNSPAKLSFVLLFSSGVKNTVYGSSKAATIPLIAPYCKFLSTILSFSKNRLFNSSFTFHIKVRFNLSPASLTTTPEVSLPILKLIKETTDNKAKTTKRFLIFLNFIIYSNTNNSLSILAFTSIFFVFPAFSPINSSQV